MTRRLTTIYLCASLIALSLAACSDSDDEPQAADAQSQPVLTVDTSVRHQQVVGFGGMYNPYIWTPSNVPATSEMNLMYAPTGLGYNILRLMIYPDEANWSRDVEGARIAQQHGAVIFACPWDSGIPGGETRLSADKYQAYADHLIAYIDYMRGQGIRLYAISMQNEPDMTFTRWTAAEVVDFMRDYGEQIRQMGVKLMAPENSRFLQAYTDAVLSDAQALANTDIMASHLYYSENGDNGYKDDKARREYVAHRYNSYLRQSGKQWWMTEHLFNDGESSSDPSDWRFREWDYQLEHLAQEIHLCMETECSAYVYWYLKRYYGMIADNSGMTYEQEGQPTGNGYILSHYARFAAGKTRVALTSSDSQILATAYIDNTGSQLSLVILNLSDSYQTISLNASATKADAVASHANAKWQQIPVTALSNGRIQMPLPARSIVSVTLR